jgi:hypothetical protein
VLHVISLNNDSLPFCINTDKDNLKYIECFAKKIMKEQFIILRQISSRNTASSLIRFEKYVTGQCYNIFPRDCKQLLHLHKQVSSRSSRDVISVNKTEWSRKC